MNLTMVALPAGPGFGFAAAFPGPVSEADPIALLSFAAAGDMKFGDRRRAANRDAFLRDAGLRTELVIGLELAHSRNVIFPSGAEEAAELARAAGGADGLVLGGDPAGRGFAASVTVADCMPIWILDRQSGAFGILHSGWRGTGILAVAVRALADRFGSRPSSFSVILGPAIGACCYEVGEERAARFSVEFGAECVRSRGASSFLDLRSANLSIAERLGVGHLLSLESCTSCDERLGSYRRQGGASFTRMLAVCGRSPCEPGIMPGGKRA